MCLCAAPAGLEGCIAWLESGTSTQPAIITAMQVEMMAGCVLVLGSFFMLFLRCDCNLKALCNIIGRGTPLEWLDSARGKAGGNTARQPGSYSPTLMTARHLPTARQPDMPDSPTAPRQAPTWGYHGTCHGCSDSHDSTRQFMSCCHTDRAPTELRQRL